MEQLSFYFLFSYSLVPYLDSILKIQELKQKIHQIKGYHVHRQRLYLNNSELLNSETLDYYGLLCEQEELLPEDQGAVR